MQVLMQAKTAGSTLFLYIVHSYFLLFEPTCTLPAQLSTMLVWVQRARSSVKKRTMDKNVSGVRLQGRFFFSCKSDTFTAWISVLKKRPAQAGQEMSQPHSIWRRQWTLMISLTSFDTVCRNGSSSVLFSFFVTCPPVSSAWSPTLLRFLAQVAFSNDMRSSLGKWDATSACHGLARGHISA